MHIAVVGAGVTGITTAYYLSQKGFDVSVFDTAQSPGMGASFGNGAQLSYSFADPMASPAMLASLLPLLLGRDPAMNVRLTFVLIPWGIRFLRECTPARAHQNLLCALKITSQSSKLIEPLLQHVSMSSAQRTAGKLVLLSSPGAMQQAEATCETKQRLGFDARLVSLAEATELEPAIATMTDNFCGAVYSGNDAVADAHHFCQSVGSWLAQNSNTELRLSTSVQSLKTSNTRVSGVLVNGELETFDAVVVCAGNASARLVKPHGIKLPIYPVRGYSVTLPSTTASPEVSITLAKRRFVISRLGSNVRIAGFADFTQHHDKDAARSRALLEVARSAAPDIAEFDARDTRMWAGDRPMTPNSLPCVGATRVPGLYLNTGHGTLGWTMACATGHSVADTIAIT